MELHLELHVDLHIELHMELTDGVQIRRRNKTENMANEAVRTIWLTERVTKARPHQQGSARKASKSTENNYAENARKRNTA